MYHTQIHTRSSHETDADTQIEIKTDADTQIVIKGIMPQIHQSIIEQDKI